MKLVGVIKRIIKEVNMNKKVKCKGCGKIFEKRLVSRKGYCRLCANMRMNAAGLQLKAKKGYFYRKWKTNWKKGVKKYLENKKRGEK